MGLRIRYSMSSRLSASPSTVTSFFPHGPSANSPGEMSMSLMLSTG